ncbi:MAG: hypothetical protein IIV24_09485, partial [Alistipes sp.]|nr:hypothetical protein [Alistipes sp.]
VQKTYWTHPENLYNTKNCFITRFCNALAAEKEGAYSKYVTDFEVARKAAKTVRNNFEKVLLRWILQGLRRFVERSILGRM